VLHHPEDPGNYFYGVAWSPDGQRLAAGTYRRGVQIFEMNEALQSQPSQPFPVWIRHVAWSPDGAQVAGGGDDGSVYIWDAHDGSLRRQLSGHYSRVTRLAWSPNGRWLASGAIGPDGGEFFVWDPQRGERIHTLEGHTRMVYAVAWGTDENTLISGDGAGKLRWWDVQSKTCRQVQDAHQGTVQSLRRSPDGTRLASCGDDGAIMLWDLHTAEHQQTIRRDRPYERLNISAIQGLTEAQRTALLALGAFES
jgi:WD40 repeat protein